jgi:hypothetical protein
VLKVLAGALLVISSFCKTCFIASVQMKQVFGWLQDYVLVHHRLFRSVTSFASVRGYSGGILFDYIYPAVLTQSHSSSAL